MLLALFRPMMYLAQFCVKSSLFDDFKALVHDFKALLIGEFGAVPRKERKELSIQ